ncbi:hypothetical protein LUZ60_015067 [Juncus effusus]|nr:hypothetical protein LUZ60_015067 [Juncus effusus]
MNGLDLPVPERYIEKDSIEEVKKLIQIVKNRKIKIIFPTDFLYCNNNNNGSEFHETFSSDEILDGWSPIDIGPKTLEKIISSISSCKKILWIGHPNLGSQKDTFGVSLSQLALALEKSSKNGCGIFIAGSTVSDAFAKLSMHKFQIVHFKSTTVIWEFLKGRILPGIAALDKAYPYSIDWSEVYSDPTLPIIVDIGSGNGLFLFQMAKKMNDSNFLGVEINDMLVNRCLNGIRLSNTKNLHFVSTNATSNFRSIISSYPGDLVIVTIQCPNPDFNREEFRWKMVQRALVESIIDLLIINGKVFLQSDIETVTIRMREQFIEYGRGKMVTNEKEWMEENPFGVRSDWELHTLARGNPIPLSILIPIHTNNASQYCVKELQHRTLNKSVIHRLNQTNKYIKDHPTKYRYKLHTYL